MHKSVWLKYGSNSQICLFFFSFPLYSCHSKPFTDCLCRICRPAPFLLPGGVHVDVPGGRAALHHAGGGVWERALAPTLLLPGGLRGSRANRGRFRCGGLPQLRHRPNVSARWHMLSSQTVWMLQKHLFFCMQYLKIMEFYWDGPFKRMMIIALTFIFWK